MKSKSTKCIVDIVSHHSWQECREHAEHTDEEQREHGAGRGLGLAVAEDGERHGVPVLVPAHGAELVDVLAQFGVLRLHPRPVLEPVLETSS